MTVGAPGQPITFETAPERYRHWRLHTDGERAQLTLAVDRFGGLDPSLELKGNSYDLSVDIELADAVQRLRFEHPEVRAVVVTSADERIFCSGANIQALARASHAHKVNFCKYTNETRNGLEDSSENSGQRFVTVINGTAAGGGYELALATDHIILADDGADLRVLEAQPLHRVGQFDIDPEVVGIELQLGAGKQSAGRINIERQGRDRPIALQPPMAITGGFCREIDLHQRVRLMEARPVYSESAPD
jgi:hypothetical protein